VDDVLVHHARRRQEHGREHAGPVLAQAAMEYQRVIVPVGNQLQRVHQLLADVLFESGNIRSAQN